MNICTPFLFFYCVFSSKGFSFLHFHMVLCNWFQEVFKFLDEFENILNSSFSQQLFLCLFYMPWVSLSVRVAACTDSFRFCFIWVLFAASKADWLRWLGEGSRIHRLQLCRRLRHPSPRLGGPVGWESCTIHRLHLSRGVRIPQRVSRIWHKNIWWWNSSYAWALGNVKYLFLVFAPWFTLFRCSSTW